MSGYKIEKLGAEFVVKFEQQALLKFSTKRLAMDTVRSAKLIVREPIALDCAGA